MTDTHPVQASVEERNRAAIELRLALGNVFPAMEVKKALFACDHDPRRAADYLTDGTWRSAKLITWNHPSLHEKALTLADETGLSESLCRETLMNCAGSLELARRKIAGLSALAN